MISQPADLIDNLLVKSMTEQPAYDGKPAKLVELTNSNGIKIVLMDIGACWLSCRLPLATGEMREVLLGVDSMQDFNHQKSYMGVIVGRYANRIAKGRFSIDGKTYQVSTNQAGNCLHGGLNGLDKRRWQIEYADDNSVMFYLESADGDQGFSGKLEIRVNYQLTDDNQVCIHYQAKTDKTTPVNLTNHAYFNLLGADNGIDCKSHVLSIDADQYLPIDSTGIPLDKPIDLAETGFDFRTAKSIGQDLLKDEQQKSSKGYDHSFVLAANRDSNKPIAELRSPDALITLKLSTNKPALQLYTGNWLAGTPARNGKIYSDYAGVALETQFLPDSPNHPEWEQPSCLLHPHQLYDFFTSYKFEF